METMFMNTENSKNNAPHKFVFNLSQRLNLRSSNKRVSLQNLTCKNIRQQYKNYKLKIKLQHQMMSFNCLTVLIQRQIFKIIY